MTDLLRLLILGLFWISLTYGNPKETFPSDAEISELLVRFEPNPSIEEIPGQLLIKDVNTMLTILQTKGHLIKKISFSGDGMTTDQVLDVCQYINWYTSLRLVELMLGDKIDHLICDAKHSFSEVKQLVIVGGEFSCDLQLDRPFPNMELLSFFATSETLIPSLARRYQQMEKLRFQQLTTMDNGNLQALVRANPQMRAISLDPMPSTDTLIMLRDSLPELSTLHLDCGLNGRQYEDDVVVQMNTVNKFVLFIGFMQNFTSTHIPIISDNLEWLEIDAKFLTDAGIKMIEQHPGLQTLVLPSMYDATEFVRVGNVVALLPALKQITLAWWPHWDFGILYQLLEMETLDVVRIRMEFDEDHSTFVSKIPRKWQLKEVTEIPMYDKRGVELKFERLL